MKNKQSNYPYGSSLINSQLKYDFDSSHSNLELKDLIFECKIYLNDKLVKTLHFRKMKNNTIGNSIKLIMIKEVEKRYPFKKKGIYRICFFGYFNKKIIRRLYKQTSNYIETQRKEYVLREIINITV